MFSDKETKAYQSIKAPKELYDKVVATKKQSNLWILPMLSTVAACFVMVIAVSFFMKSAEPVITLNGQGLESSIVYYDVAPASQMRSPTVLHVPMEIEVSKDTEITVLHGQITLQGEKPATSVSVSSKATIQWEIPQSKLSQVCEMKLTDKDGVTTITLEYDNTEITVTKRRTEK